MRAWRGAVGTVVPCAALLGGCQPDEPVGEPATLNTPDAAPATDASPSPSPEPTQPPTPTAPSPTPDPFAVPATIDAAYVERVLNALYEIDTETTRLALEAGTLTPEVRERIEAVDAPEEAEIQSVAFSSMGRGTGSATIRGSRASTCRWTRSPIRRRRMRPTPP